MNAADSDFTVLFEETKTLLLAYLTRRTTQADAADLLSETYLIAWRRRADLPAGDERRLWLSGVARRLLAHHHRSHARGGAPVHGPVHAPPAPDTDRDARQVAVVRAVLDDLPEVDRELRR